VVRASATAWSKSRIRERRLVEWLVRTSTVVMVAMRGFPRGYGWGSRAPRRGVALSGRKRRVGGRVDGKKEKGEPDRLVDPRPGRGAVVDHQVEARHGEESQRAWARDTRAPTTGMSAMTVSTPSDRTRPASVALCSRRTAAARATTVTVAKKTMKRESEPVLALALVQDHLEGSETERHQAESHVVHPEPFAEPGLAQSLEIRGRRRAARSGGETAIRSGR